MIPFIKKGWKPLAVILLVAFLLWRAYSFGVDSTNSTWNLKWVQRDLVDSTVALHAEVAERTKEQKRQYDADEEAKNAQTALVQVHAEYLNSEFAANELRDQLAQLQQQFKRSETGRISAVAAASEAKAEVASLLAQLLGEADKMAGDFAREADERYVAGKTCERTYDKVTKVE